MYNLLNEIKKAGGATVITTSKQGRYVVGNNRYGSVMPMSDDINVFELVVAMSLLMNGDDYTDYDGFGFWIEPDNFGRDMIFSDPVKLFDDYERAELEARRNGEIAIWDSVEQTSIYMEQNH